MAAHNARPAIPAVAENTPQAGWGNWLIAIARTLNLVLRGKINATASVTLNAGATSTTIYDSRIGIFSHVGLEAQTASAATARLTAPGIYIAPGNGSAVIHHPNNAATDQLFSALIVG